MPRRTKLSDYHAADDRRLAEHLREKRTPAVLPREPKPEPVALSIEAVRAMRAKGMRTGEIAKACGCDFYAVLRCEKAAEDAEFREAYYRHMLGGPPARG